MAEYKLRIVIEGEDKASGALGGVANSLQRIGEFATGGVIAHGITKGIGGLKNLFTGAIASAADFEQTLNFMQQVLSATDEQMGVLTQQALDLGRETVFSTVEAAQGQLELAKAGMTVQQTFDAMPGVLALAAAGQIEVADAATVASNAINAYQLDAGEMTRVADLFSAAANASSVDIVDLAYSQRMASAVAASYGMSIEDVTTALAIMGNYGLKNSDAGTSLKQMLLSLTGPTQKASDAMGELGIVIYDAEGKMRPFEAILANLGFVAQKLDEETRNAAFSTIFGSDAVRAANILIAAGSKGWDDMAEKVNQYGAAQQLAEAQTRGMSGALEYFKGTWESMTVEGATPLLAGLSDAIRNIADIMSSPEIMDGIRTFAAQAGAILELTVQQFFGAFTAAGGGWEGVRAGLEAVIGMGFEEIPGKLREAMLSGLKNLGADLWTSISTGASEWATTQFESIRATLSEKMAGIWPGLQAALPLLMDTLFPAPDWITNIGNYLKWPELPEWMTNIGEHLKWPGVPEWMTNIADNLKWPGVPDWITNIGDNLTWPGVPDWITNIGEHLKWPGVPEWMTNIKENFKWPEITVPPWLGKLFGGSQEVEEVTLAEGASELTGVVAVVDGFLVGEGVKLESAVTVTSLVPVEGLTLEVAGVTVTKSAVQKVMERSGVPEMEGGEGESVPTIENPLAGFTWHWPPLPEFTWPSLPTWTWPEIAMPSWLWPDIPRPNWIGDMSVPRPGWLGELLAWSPIVTVRSGGSPSAPAFNNVGLNAAGTSYWRGGLTWVGERGAELVNLPRGTAIYSAAQSRNMALAGAGVTVNVTANVANDLDVQSLAYRIADVISRRRR